MAATYSEAVVALVAAGVVSGRYLLISHFTTSQIEKKSRCATIIAAEVRALEKSMFHYINWPQGSARSSFTAVLVTVRDRVLEILEITCSQRR